MRKWILVAMAWNIGTMPVFCEEVKTEDIARNILLCCRCPEDPLPEEDLAAYAAAQGLSDSEVSEMLVAFVEDGIHAGTDPLQRQLACASIWALARFGGEKESNYVREIMRTTQDAGLQRAALLVGMRLTPEKWEEWVREVAGASRFGSLTRFVAYEEVFRIGKNGSEQTQKRMEQVMSELKEMETSPGNKNRLQGWSDELKKR